MERESDKSKKIDHGYKTVRNVAVAAFLLFALFYSLFVKNPEGMEFVYRLESLLYDMKVKMRPPSKPSSHIAIAKADIKALKKYGRWPWDRSAIAELIENLMARGAKGVVFDMVFADHKNSPLEDKAFELAKVQNIELETGEEKLRDMLEKYGNKIVMGAVFLANTEYVEKDAADKNFKNVDKKLTMMLKDLDKGKHKDQPPVHVGWEGVDLPLDIFLNTPVKVAAFNTSPDSDAYVRKYTVVQAIKSGDKWTLMPTLALSAAEIYMGIPAKISYSSEGIEKISVGKIEIPLSSKSEGMSYINYSSLKDDFYQFSIADSMNADVKDKIVFVAATAIGTWDQKVTPLEENIPGIFIHTSFFNNFLKNDFAQFTSWASIFPFIFLLIPLIFIRVIYHRVVLWQAILFAFIYSILLFAVSYIFHINGIISYIFTPILFLWLMVISTYVGKYFFVDKERGQIKTAFSKYLDPRLLNRVVEGVNNLELYGERKEIVILFGDIMGFTNISEGLAPDKLVQLINRLFTPVTSAIFQFSGFLDKYMGDAVMALFGVPIEIDNKEKQACSAAIEMIRRIDILRAELKDENLPDIKMGIGLNAGDAAVGNMGSNQRFDYSAIGDSVNLAARLEGLTRKYGINIMVSESVYAKTKNEFLFRELDVVQVKGKDYGVRIFQLFEDQSEENLKIRREYEDALTAFKSNNMKLVIELYQKTSFKDDGPFLFLHERAQEMNIDGTEYNGVWKFSSK